MTIILDLDYTAPGVAAADVPLWVGSADVLAYTAGPYLGVEAWSSPASTTRSIPGLTVDTQYDLTINVSGFDGDGEYAIFTAAIGGESAVLTSGLNTLTFTATTTAADLTVTVDADVSWGGVSVSIAGLSVTNDEPPAPAITVTGTTSHLNDTVDIVGQSGTGWDVTLATLPAYVGYQTVGIDSEVNRTAFLEALRVILPACSFDATLHRIRWRGELYLPDGPAMLRRRRGRDLTLTVPIKFVTG